MFVTMTIFKEKNNLYTANNTIGSGNFAPKAFTSNESFHRAGSINKLNNYIV